MALHKAIGKDGGKKMNKRVAKKAVSVLATLSLALSLCGCSVGAPKNVPIEVSDTRVEVELDDKTTVEIENYDDLQDVEVEVSDKDIIKVKDKNGTITITGLEEGKAKITITASNSEDEITIKVTVIGVDHPAESGNSGSSESSTTVAEYTPDVAATVQEPEPEPEPSPYAIITDGNGNPIDLGGVNVIIRDWWSYGDLPCYNDYDEARIEYLDWCQETYNFTVSRQAISDWGSAPQDLVDYVITGGDDNYYVFIIRPDAATTSAMSEGLMYDLSTLDCLDFNHNPIFTRNQIDETYSVGNSIYCMYADNNGFSDPKAGIYFNKRILADAGIDPESIYDMQDAGTWTWDAWIEMLDTVTRDIDNDGIIDIYGCGENYNDLISGFVFSNGGTYVNYDRNGKFRIALEDPDVLEGLNMAKEVMDKYDVHNTYVNGESWDFYKEDWLNGHFAFYPGQVWEVDNVTEIDDEVGFVTFPVGPSAGNDYASLASDNLSVIPACYDADKAWKCAFAYSLYFGDVPGYEDYIESLNIVKDDYYSKFDDAESVDSTIVRIIRTSDYEIANIVPGLDINADFIWNIYTNGPDISSVIEATKSVWQKYIDEANARR